jgi:hypothetical protein
MRAPKKPEALTWPGVLSLNGMTSRVSMFPLRDADGIAVARFAAPIRLVL